MKVELAKAKQRAYDDLCPRLDNKESKTDLYRLARQKDRDGKVIQLSRVYVAIPLPSLLLYSAHTYLPYNGNESHQQLMSNQGTYLSCWL